MSRKKTVAGTAGDPTVNYAKVELDGQTFSLAFDFNSIAIAEETAGVNLLRALGSLSDLTALQFRGLLFAALIKAQPQITVDQAGSLIRIDTMAKIQLALADAYVKSMPERKEENPPQPIEAAA